MGLASRRRYRWTRGRISDYWDEVFTADGLEGHAALDDQSAFIASLGSNRSARMRDVLGTIQADQDAIIRAGSRGALVVDGGPGTGKTVVALHRTAYLLYSDPRLGHRRGGVLFVGPHQPYLAYVADVLPSLGEEGVQTCTLRDLVARGRRGGGRDRPGGGPAEVVRGHGEGDRAGRPVLRGAADRGHGRSRPPYADIWLSAADWAEAFDAPRPGHAAQRGARPGLGGAAHDPGRQARADDEDVAADLRPPVAARRTASWPTAFNRAWPLLEATDLVGDLWAVPAYLRMCAPWLEPDEVRAAAARGPPGLDGRPTCRCSTRPGSGSATRRRRAASAGTRRPSPPSAQRMDRVVDEILQADDDEGMMAHAAPGRTCATPWSTRPRCPTPTRTCSPARSRTSSSTRRRS